MVGAVIGSYQLVRKLGEGGMGAVYLGQHTLLGRRAAIKVLLPQLSARPDIVSRFFNEARAVTSISDPGIVQVFDFGYHTDGSAFIVMEYLEGEPLDQRLAKLRRFSVPDALRLCRQIATSLGAAHAQHIIHRDLKPENIFLVRDAEVASGERSKILDFGIAKLSDEDPSKQNKTHVGALMGTPVYMSPEQCRGLPDIDHRADIYSLVCVLFHLLTGRPPFEGLGMGDIISAHIREPAPLASSVAPGIPASVDALVLRGMAKSPAERYGSMGELAAAIGQVLHELPADGVPGAMHGGHSSSAMAAPSYYSQPPHTPPPHTPPPPAPMSMMSQPPSMMPSQPPMPPTTVPPYVSNGPTTLGGAGAGQVAVAPAKGSSVGRWIAGGLILAAVGVGIAVVAGGGGGKDGAHVAARDIPGLSSAQTPTPEVVPAPAPNPTPAPAPNPTTTETPPTAGSAADKPATPATGSAADKPATPAAGSAADKPTPPATAPAAGSAADKPATEPPLTPAADKPTSRPGHRPSASPSARRCSRAEFAAVFDAPAPSSTAVHAALRSLKLCHESKALNDADFDRYQAALVSKL